MLGRPGAVDAGGDQGRWPTVCWPTDRVALEVTGSSWEIVRLLEPHVSKVIVVSPGDTGISQARAKTDRLDARTLAKLLWTGELEAVWVPPEWIAGCAGVCLAATSWSGLAPEPRTRSTPC